MTIEVAQVASITNPFEQLVAVTQRLAETTAEISELSTFRRGLVAALQSQGYSHATNAAAAGLSRGRIHQILH